MVYRHTPRVALCIDCAQGDADALQDFAALGAQSIASSVSLVTPPTLLDVLMVEVATLDSDQLQRLADRLAPLLDRLADRRPRVPPGTPALAEGWLNARDAAAYLGLSTGRVQKAAASGQIPHEQDGPGCRLWFRRDQIDAWRRGETGAVEAPGCICASKTLPPSPFQASSTNGRKRENPA